MISAIKNYLSKAFQGQLGFNQIFITLSLLAYLIQFFVIRNIVLIKGFYVIDVLLATIACIYFIAHIVICRKTQKINKAKNQDQQDKGETNIAKSVSEKILLKKPIVKSDGFNTLIAIDLLLIVINIDYVI